MGSLLYSIQYHSSLSQDFFFSTIETTLGYLMGSLLYSIISFLFVLGLLFLHNRNQCGLVNGFVRLYEMRIGRHLNFSKYSQQNFDEICFNDIKCFFPRSVVICDQNILELLKVINLKIFIQSSYLKCHHYSDWWADSLTDGTEASSTSRGTRRNTSTHLYFQGRTHEEQLESAWMYQQRNQEEHLYTSLLIGGTHEEQLESARLISRGTRRNTSTHLYFQRGHSRSPRTSQNQYGGTPLQI